MIDLKMNLKGMYEDTTCVGCFQTEETTEHFFECPKYKEITRVQVKGNEPFKSTEWLTQAAEHKVAASNSSLKTMILGIVKKSCTLKIELIFKLVYIFISLGDDSWL